MKLKTILLNKSGAGDTSLKELDSKNTAAFVFGAPRFMDEPGPLNELVAALPNSRVVGCSTSGEIHGSRVFDDSLAVAIAKFDGTRVEVASVPIGNTAHSFQAGWQIANALNAPDLSGVVVLSDGLSVNGSDLVRGLNSVLSKDVVVTGGLAGDGDRFKRTWVLQNGKPTSGAISAIGFYGNKVHLGHGSKGGWDIFGPERLVTRSEGNVLYELDGKPALNLYKEYLGERAAGLPATALLFPLALRSTASDPKSLVRTVLGVDEKNQSMTFAGDIPQGYRAQLMRANFDRLIDGAYDAATMSSAEDKTNACLALAISCVGRRLILGARTEEEVEATLETLPKGSEQVGFYSYGEISPFVQGQHCDLHNQTMTLTTIRED